MAKRRSTMLLCIVLYLLVLFITGTQPRDVGHIGSFDNSTIQDTVPDLGASFAVEKSVNWDTFHDYAFKGTGYIGVMECPDTPQTFFPDRAALVDNSWL
ncbi:hypothetical protein LTR56_012731 [Elasticomyces elasticus]|nr:hypothetical protein LTR22_022984 [Elasticomyces elasticus]KAK3639008.1 hypothetical protein LTR56_012731 [Elasticomyces elasticus]KAK4918738.1 hypothetical protein LTR49_013525 [Elasticomyces elasticus]KAK5754433.1 hypothetical protein LTS12_015502 [Elasticomyces elasticus]